MLGAMITGLKNVEHLCTPRASRTFVPLVHDDGFLGGGQEGPKEKKPSRQAGCSPKLSEHRVPTVLLQYDPDSVDWS